MRLRLSFETCRLARTTLTLLLALPLVSCATASPSPRADGDALVASPQQARADRPATAGTLPASSTLISPSQLDRPEPARRRAPRLSLVGRLGGRAHGLAGHGDRLYYLRGGFVVVLDAADPDGPREIAQSAMLPHPATRLETLPERDLLVLYGERALMLLSIGKAATGANEPGVAGPDPIAPHLHGSLDLDERARAIALGADSRTLWVAGSDRGLLAVDIADPATPRIVGRLPAPEDIVDLTLRGTLAYVVDRRAGLLVVDVADPSGPRELGRFDDDGDALSVLLVEPDLAYVSTTHRFWVVDVSDPRRPRKVWQPKEMNGPEGRVEVRGGFTLSRLGGTVLLHGYRLMLLDTDDPRRPRVGSFARAENGGGWIAAGSLVDAAGAWWASGPGTEGDWELMRFRAEPSDSPAALTIAALHALAGPLDVWWPTIEAGFEAGTLLYGSHVIDISDPTSLRSVGEAGPAATWSYALDLERRLMVTSNTTSFSDTLEVWDFRNPLAPSHRSTLRGRISGFGEPWHATEIALAGDMAYVAGDWGGWGCPVFAVVDLSDPTTPRERGFLDGGEGGDLQSNYCRMALSADAATLLAVDCGTSCDTMSEGGWGRLDLIDVRDPDAPALAARARTEHEAYDVALRGHKAYVAAGPRGLEVYDVADPASPSRVAALAVGSFVRWVEPLGDGYLVLGDRRALHVVDVRETTRPMVVDTYPVPVREDLGGLAYVERQLWVGGREAGLLGYAVGW